MSKKKRLGGFTLIELALSLIFIAILSVTVVLLIQNTTASYQRGLILNQVNTVGMDLIDDFRLSVQNSSSDDIIKMCETFYSEGSSNRSKCINDHANSFVSVTKRAKVTVGGTTVGDNMPVYGAFCTGTYTYIWNSGYFEQAEYDGERKVMYGAATLGAANLVSSSGANVKSNFRLLKIYDAERTICVNAMKAQPASSGGANYVEQSSYNPNNIPSSFKIDQTMINADPDNEGGVELMNRDDTNDLVLYDLYVSKPAYSDTRKNFFFSSAFILGTRRGGINIKVAGNSCKPPSDDLSELEYCAINKFNFAVQAGGK